MIIFVGSKLKIFYENLIVMLKFVLIVYIVWVGLE